MQKTTIKERYLLVENMIRMMSLITYDLAKSTENGISAWTQRLQAQEAIVYDLQILEQQETTNANDVPYSRPMPTRITNSADPRGKGSHTHTRVF